MLATFTVTLIAVAGMLMYAVPGFLFVKTKLIKAESISAFAVILLYVCTPTLYVYAFQKCTFSWDLLKDMGIFLALVLAVQALVLGLAYLILRKKYEDVKYRIMTVACALSNATFFGIPLVETILPEYPDAPVFCSVFGFTMSIIGWTVGSFIITGDRKHFSLKKLFFNPASLGIAAGLVLFVSGIQLPKLFGDMITLLGKMSTPLSMLVLGMRLAGADFRKMFASGAFYLTSSAKLLFMPLLSFALAWFLPIDPVLKVTLFVICSCPTATSVLNFAELHGEGQETASYLVLLSTILSVITVPAVTLLVL